MFRGPRLIFSFIFFRWDQNSASCRPLARPYGFGWNIDHYRGERCLWHGGTTSGFRTLIKRFPDRCFTVIILTNRNQPNGGAILETLSRHITDLWLIE